MNSHQFRTPAGQALARQRIRLCYLWRHGRLPELDSPQRFTELVQLRKLTDGDPRMTRCLDKLEGKAIAEHTLGREWIVPTLWSGQALPDANPFGVPAIVKARHGCNQNAVLREMPAPSEWQALRRRTRGWTERPYGIWLDEPAYRDIPRGLIAERLLGNGGALPDDYKVYVFGGVATHVQVHLEREHSHRWVLCDRGGRPLVEPTEGPPPLPSSLSDMLDAAERLAAGFSFARVDFYEVAGRPLFGEYSFYPGSGLDPFAADWIDFELGDLWRAALGDPAIMPRTERRRTG
jgi:hypothetical protein